MIRVESARRKVVRCDIHADTTSTLLNKPGTHDSQEFVRDATTALRLGHVEPLEFRITLVAPRPMAGDESDYGFVLDRDEGGAGGRSLLGRMSSRDVQANPARPKGFRFPLLCADSSHRWNIGICYRPQRDCHNIASQLSRCIGG